MKKTKPNSKYLKSEYTTKRVTKEIEQGLGLLNGIDAPIITILGSHKPKLGNKYYNHAYKLAHMLGEMDYAIVTGGGPGIMEAANKGAADASAISVGVRAALLKNEKVDHKYFTKQISYHFLFVRRFILSLKSNALVFYPGGLGTLNELFEYLVLIQLAFIDRVPVICVDKKYWKGLFDWLDKNPKKAGFYIDNKADTSIVQFADSQEEVIKLIKKSGL
jgi:uncharacterized protein (TIGR00730 family)